MQTRMTAHLAAPPSRVYRALLDPVEVQAWLVPPDMTSEVHQFEPWEGGRFRISLTYDEPTRAGKTRQATDTYAGVFVRLVPDRELVQVLEFETDDPRLQGQMRITYRLAEDDGGTTVTGVHEDLPPGLSEADNELGWRLSMEQLARLVERD